MKHAYYNFAPDSVYTKPSYNLNKWLEAMRTIYTNVHFGSTFKDAFGTVTDNWNSVEKRDFNTWLEYYQEGNQNKYKIANANFYVNDNIPGYFLPGQTNRPSPIESAPDVSQPMSMVQNSIGEITSKEEKRILMEEQRKKIIGRLNAAVKHLTSHEGHMLAGEEFDKLLSAMYELIKQFQTVNKVSLSSQLYADLIIRQSNKLLVGGFERSSKFLRKFAQGNIGRLDATGPLPIASQNTGVEGGDLGNPSAPVDAIVPPTLPDTKEDVPDTLDELFDNLENAGLTDLNSVEDKEKDELGDISLDDDSELVIEAQLVPGDILPESPVTPEESFRAVNTDRPIPEIDHEVNIPVGDGDLEVSLPQADIIEEMSNRIDADAVDLAIDKALSSISVHDVITKLNNVTSIFRNRQLSRELMTIDMMLHRLGLISLFPELAESNQKLLEAHSYILSRLEKITSQLNGTISNTEIDLDVSPSAPSPQAQLIKEKIEDDQQKNKDMKERRKKLENMDLERKEDVVDQKPIIQELANTPTQIVQ